MADFQREAVSLYGSLYFLLLHGVLLFCFGTLLSFHFFTPPLWITALLVLYWVPRDLMCSVWEIVKRRTSRERRLALLYRCGLIIALSAPYAVLPGNLFAYPVSDAGFHLLVGRRMQSWVVSFIQSPGSPAHPRHYRKLPWDLKLVLRGTLCDYSGAMEACTTRPQSHLAFIQGGGFGHWGLIVGAPGFKVTVNGEDYVREMWPGVYYYFEVQ